MSHFLFINDNSNDIDNH